MSELNDQTPQQRLSEIKKLGDTTESITKIKELLVDFPDFIWGRIKLGLVYRSLGDRKSALTTFEEAIKLAPNNQKLKLELSSEQLYFKQFAECRKNLQEILDINPQEIWAYFKLGMLYRQENNRAEALKLFQKAAALSPKIIQIQINCAIELIYFNKLEEAERQLTKALEYNPCHFDLLMHLGYLAKKQQKVDLALGYYQKIIAHHPKRIKPHLRIIDILITLDDLPEVKNKLEILYQEYPENFHVLIYSGHLEKKLGQRTKALQWFRNAKEKASNIEEKLESQILAVEELRALGRLEEAIKFIDPIIQEFPHSIWAQMVKGSILQEQNNLTAAVNIYKSILSREQNHLNCRIELAKTYRQLGQIETAISLLEKTYQSLGANIQIFMQLGFLNQALEDWDIAGKWYQKICQEYPNEAQGYCLLANLMSLQGDIYSAINLLDEAQVIIPNSLPIILKLIECQLLLGNFNLSIQLIQEELKRFPNNAQLLSRLCRVQMEQGDYNAALTALDQISTDDRAWIRRTEQLRADIYFYKYNYQQAEDHFRKAISLTSTPPWERNRLAAILMLTGRIDEARQELKIATEELNPGKSVVPLRNHAAMITNELRIHPPLWQKLQAVQQEKESKRILGLASILAQEPLYLGSALYLARELRTQGIFDQIQQALSKNSTNLPSIPKRIVQFWDEPQPPQEVQRICQSWSQLNPEYEYIRFSLKTAIAFVKEHYDKKVLKAFYRCDQPATQADFFRLAYLNKMGGFYADADDLCHQSLDSIVNLNPELVVLQEELAVFGNNFLGCVPGQAMIRTAFYQAVNNLSDYCNESPWFSTGPALITSTICSGLLPYLTYKDYQLWPRLLVLSQAQLRKIVNQHMQLPYKKTARSWHHNAYERKVTLAPS